MTLKMLRHRARRLKRPQWVTLRQWEVLRFVIDAWLVGYVPTVRDIGERFNISSPNGVMCHLVALEKKGFMRSIAGRKRILTDQTMSMVVGTPKAKGKQK